MQKPRWHAEKKKWGRDADRADREVISKKEIK
jgi:hypothetical protein